MQKEYDISRIFVPKHRVAIRTIAARTGFTLIELMVVVVIIAIISGILVPKLLSMYDRSRGSTEERVLPPSPSQASGEALAPQPDGVPPVIESASMTITLASTYHRIGLDVYARYEVHCQSRLVFRRSTEDENPVLLTIPLPEGRAEARDVRLTLTRLPDGDAWEPDNLEYRGQRLYWSGTLADDEQLIADVNFVALGREQFEYRLPPARQLRSLDVTVELTGAASPSIPNHALQPTETRDQRFLWQFNNLVTDRAITLDIPGALSPLGRVLLLVRLLAIAVLLFGLGLWYLGEQWQPGHLKNFRWGHFLLLALTYALYFIIFAVISFQEHVTTWLAMVVAALFSWPLLLLHVTRVTTFAFAYRRIMPLAVFTLGVVINGVYGGPVRDYVFIAAVVFVIAYLTLTYEQWEQGRADYREQQRAKYEKRIKAMREKFSDVVKQRADDVQSADMEAEHLLSGSEQPELMTERYALVQQRQPVAELVKTYQGLAERLPDSGMASHEFEHDWYDEFEVEIEQFGQDAQETLAALRGAIDDLAARKHTLRVERDERRVYCVACGQSVPPTRFCPECGTARYKEMTCRECEHHLLLPLHLIPEEVALLDLYCPQCGEHYEPILLKPPES